ncbi:Fc.00g098060.m01.CDS01 [Cosmosporella sp. VM-42]
MEFRTLTRPASKLLNASRTTLSLTSTRGHKTTSRTKRSLKIAPHDSFLPDRSTSFPAADSIIYNPPSSEASPFHTPFLFLPRNDPRRAAFTRLRHTAGSPVAIPKSEADLPPEMDYKRRNPNYNLTVEDIKEMKRLRNEDPIKWSAAALAEKFNCSNMFVRMAAPAPEEHLKALKAKEARREARWGPIRTAAREDRKRRTEMLYRGQL